MATDEEFCKDTSYITGNKLHKKGKMKYSSM